MKIRLILLLSLLANAVTLAYFLVGDRLSRTPGTQALQNADTPAPAASSVRPPARPASIVVVTNTSAGRFHWGELESPDYRQYIANLRAIGCPEATIRDLIVADVEKLYAGKAAALYPSPRDFKFWRVEDRQARAEERERDLKRRELEKEKRALLTELLGVDPLEAMRAEGRADREAWRLGFLSADKQQALQALSSKYRELERAAWSEGGRGGRTPEARAEMAALRAQRDAEMAQLLGPQDYQEYQLRNSPVAREMRESLGPFQPSEDEFRRIFELRKPMEEQLAFNRGGPEEAARDQRRAVQQQMDAQLRAALGEERFREYQLSQDERYRDIYNFTDARDLPKSTATALYDMRQAAEAQRQQIFRDPALAPEQRSAALSAIAQETQRAVSGMLGPDTFKEYTQRDGNWLNRLGTAGERGRGPGEPGPGPGGRGRGR